MLIFVPHFCSLLAFFILACWLQLIAWGLSSFFFFPYFTNYSVSYLLSSVQLATTFLSELVCFHTTCILIYISFSDSYVWLHHNSKYMQWKTFCPR